MEKTHLPILRLLPDPVTLSQQEALPTYTQISLSVHVWILPHLLSLVSILHLHLTDARHRVISLEAALLAVPECKVIVRDLVETIAMECEDNPRPLLPIWSFPTRAE
jgi:hypothetical protein